jgi:hypothetical protein
MLRASQPFPICETCGHRFWAETRAETICRECRPADYKTACVKVTAAELRVLKGQAEVYGLSVDSLLRMAVDAVLERMRESKARHTSRPSRKK